MKLREISTDNKDRALIFKAVQKWQGKNAEYHHTYDFMSDILGYRKSVFNNELKAYHPDMIQRVQDFIDGKELGDPGDEMPLVKHLIKDIADHSETFYSIVEAIADAPTIERNELEELTQGYTSRTFKDLMKGVNLARSKNKAKAWVLGSIDVPGVDLNRITTVILPELKSTAAMETAAGVFADFGYGTKASIMADVRAHLKKIGKAEDEVNDKISELKSPAAAENTEEDFLVWDGEISRFVERRNGKLRYHGQGSFKQTLRSRNGWTAKMAGEFLGTVEEKYVVYRPGGKVDRDELNIWRGIGYGDADGDYDLIMKILDNLFIGQEDAKEEFINWMAFIVQAQKRTGVAWGFFGAAGSGKGFVAELMRNLVGAANSRMNIGDDLLKSQFNEYAYRTQFIHLNEIASDFHGRHGVAGKLKALVTDPYLSINIKNMSIFDAENFANVILNSNKPNPIELDMDDRRWNMIISHQSLTTCDWFNRKTYKKAMRQWRAFGIMLMSYEVDKDRATSPMKMSAAKQRVSELTTALAQRVAIAMKKGDYEKLSDIAQYDADDISVREFEKQLERCCKDGKYPNSIVQEIYNSASGEDISSQKVANRMIPFMTGWERKRFRLKMGKGDGIVSRGWLKKEV